jgi:GWxTD domain-containing protein
MLLPSLILALGLGPQTAPPQLAVRAVRFYEPSGGETPILALVQVPYALTEVAGNRIAWQTAVTVTDSAGTALLAEKWWSGAPASYRVPDAYGMEPLRFQVKPGHYTLTVTVTDSLTGRSATTSTELVGFGAPPSLSDLLVASNMRIVTAGDTTSLPGEIARGSMRFVTSPEVMLDALKPMVAFMVESYSATETSATTQIKVMSQDGQSTIYELAPFEQTIPAGGGVIRGQFPLDGLGEGSYLLSASVTSGGHTVERTAPFAIGSLEVAMQREMARKTAERGLDETYFGAMGEDELDEAAEVLAVLVKPSELEAYRARGDGALTVLAKRRFLIQFWAGRDDTPETPVNETRMRFYDAIEYANAQYGESGRNAQPGWKTDRGRIFIKHGKPSESQAFVQGQGSPPFEIWKYSQGRPQYYIFVDRNNFGNFKLIKTNDLTESSAPNWCEILNPLVIQRDVEPYLGQRFFFISGGNAAGTEGAQQSCS